MSKIRHPDTEPSVTCGFYNSLNGDRKHDALAMSSIFDGVIADGVFATVGDGLQVVAGTDNTVIVKPGKCWFNHTFTNNDADLPVVCDDSEILQGMNRIDAIVVEIDGTEAVRDNSIVFKKGVPASSPVRPSMEHTELKNEYPLCYIYRSAESKEITNGNITSAIGTADTPYVTGLIDTIDPEQLLLQWTSRLDEFCSSEEEDFEIWYDEMKQMMSDVGNELDAWTSDQQAKFLAWFDEMKNQLNMDAAGNLQNQINTINETIENVVHSEGVSGMTFSIDENGVLIVTYADA